MGYELSLPINTTLSFLILYYVKNIIWPPSKETDSIATDYNLSYNWLPAKHPPTVVWKRYTPRTLEPFNGKDGGRILLAIKGKVFDVTDGRSFYGPGTLMDSFAYLSDNDTRFIKTDHMETLLGETPRGGWQNNPSILVNADAESCTLLLKLLSEMLTPLDQPIDKLEDLTPSEMYVPSFSSQPETDFEF
jgi:membrane-associated progesterone receptor component